jgi:hypothetical protein
LDEIVKRRQSIMRKAKRNKKDSSGTQPQELSDLLREALQQPGVRELMAVYENWKMLEDVTRPHRQAMGVKRIISASNVSGPTVRQIT